MSQIRTESAFAVAELKQAGPLVGISGNCGFMMWYQARVRELTSTPVFMSALVQAPLVEAAIGRDAKVLLLTANSKTLLAARTGLPASLSDGKEEEDE